MSGPVIVRIMGGEGSGDGGYRGFIIRPRPRGRAPRRHWVGNGRLIIAAIEPSRSEGTGTPSRGNHVS